MKRLDKELALYRAMQNATQQDIAKKLDVPLSTYQHWEGGAIPHYDNYKRLLEYLNGGKR